MVPDVVIKNTAGNPAPENQGLVLGWLPVTGASTAHSGRTLPAEFRQAWQALDLNQDCSVIF